jgi:hypothetical protein
MIAWQLAAYAMSDAAWRMAILQTLLAAPGAAWGANSSAVPWLVAREIPFSTARADLSPAIGLPMRIHQRHGIVTESMSDSCWSSVDEELVWMLNNVLAKRFSSILGQIRTKQPHGPHGLQV